MLALWGTFVSWETLDSLVLTRYVIDLLSTSLAKIVMAILMTACVDIPEQSNSEETIEWFWLREILFLWIITTT